MTLKRFLLVYFLVLLVVFLLVTLSPIAFKSDQNIVSGTGAIIFLDFEGGFYGILSDDGEHYDPVNLSKEFQVDGLRVRFEIEENILCTVNYLLNKQSRNQINECRVS